MYTSDDEDQYLTHTPNLSIPYILSTQAKKEFSINMGLAKIDAMLGNSLQDIYAQTPPPSPHNGVLYHLGKSPTGLWEKYPHHMAYYQDEWEYFEPRTGMLFWCKSKGALLVFKDQNWHTLMTLADPLESGDDMI